MTIKEKVKELWKLCFDDSEEFTDLYFQYRYSNKVNISIQSGDNIIAALQMIPYPMSFYGSDINTSYISGACTHPDYRGKGVMKELLSQAFAQMTRKGVYVSTLIPAEPWLFGYYARAGYTPLFRYSETRIKVQDLPVPEGIIIEQSVEFDEKVYSYFNEEMHKRPCCIQHGSDDYRIILKDIKLSGGTVFIARDAHGIKAMAFVEPQDDTLQVKEAFGDAPEKEIIIQQAARHYKSHDIILITPPNGEDKPIGMARIIYAKAMLQMYASANPKKELNIHLTDEELSLNNGYYYLIDGKCMTTKKRLPGTHLELTIGELTQMLLSPLHPYMSLMLD